MCVFACWGSQELWVSDLRCCALGGSNNNNNNNSSSSSGGRGRGRGRTRGSGNGNQTELMRDFSFDMIGDLSDHISMEVPSLNFETTATLSRNQVGIVVCVWVCVWCVMLDALCVVCMVHFSLHYLMKCLAYNMCTDRFSEFPRSTALHG